MLTELMIVLMAIWILDDIHLQNFIKMPMIANDIKLNLI